MAMLSAKRLVILCLLGAASGCAVFTVPAPGGRSGTLTTPDGAPVADAVVTVDSWSIGMAGQPLACERTYTTMTDRDGRWVVPGQAAIRAGIFAPDAVPLHVDEITFRAPGQLDLHAVFPPRPGRPESPEPSTMHVDESGPAPLSVVTLPAVGGMAGAGQKYSVHVGAMAVVSRGGPGAGARAAAEVGAAGLGGTAGVVIIPVDGTTPNVAVELNARYVTRWSPGADARAESGPEIGVDLLGYRLTLAWLASAIDTPASRRRFVFGFGFGHF
jgi:hypothetical protein